MKTTTSGIFLARQTIKTYPVWPFKSEVWRSPLQMRTGEKWIWPWMLFNHIAPANAILICWCFNDRKNAFLHEHVGATEWKRWDCQGSKMFIYCASSLSCDLAQWGTAVQNSICYHMNQPLQNNDLELAEASSTGVDVTWLCSCFAICECKRTMSWKTFPWKQQRSGTGAQEGSGLSLFTRVGGWRGTSCAWEREQAAGCYLAPCFPPSG